MPDVAEETIRAAGAVLWRLAGEATGQPPPDASGTSQARRELALVHRPHRKDWSFPKGKLEPGEHPVVGAVREVFEETGLQVSLGRPLPSRRYRVDGRPKHVRYWAARVPESARLTEFVPFEEIDELVWLPETQARELLSYEHDGALVTALRREPLDTVPLVVVRHAKAVKRAQWAGTVDSARPLEARGIAQARRLVPLLSAYGIAAVHTSDSTRCRDTVLPFARSLELPVVDEPLLSEEGHARARKASRARMAELLGVPQPLAVCSHRPVLPDLLGILPPRGAAREQAPLAPGAMLVLHRVFYEGRASVVAVERHRS